MDRSKKKRNNILQFLAVSISPRYHRPVLALLLLFVVLALLSRHSRFVSKEETCAILDERTPVRSSNDKLPKIIHQQWKDNKPLTGKYALWQDTVKKTFPNHQYMLWTDEKALKLIEDEFPFFLKTYKSFPKEIMRVDSVRYFIMYKYGGLYLDMDYQVLENFWNRLPDDRAAVIQSFSHLLEISQNSLMTSPPGLDFWKVTWEVMEERSKTGSTDPIWTTGPRMLDEALIRYRYFENDRVLVLPCENWQRVTIGNEAFIHRAWKTFAYTFGIFKNCGDVRDQTCLMGVHHGTTSWM